MRIVKVQQGSAEWLKVRCGRVTASRVGDVLGRLKNGSEGAPRRNSRMALIAERLTGKAEDHFVSQEMIWGSEYEQFARTAYELSTETMIDQVGFAIHPTMDYAGASPDGLIGSDGGIELKCPKTTTHLTWRMAGVVPEEHAPQMFWNMACTGAAWWDFVSYDPRLPENLRLFVTRLERNDKVIAGMEIEVRQMHEEVGAILAVLGAPEWTPYTPVEPPPYEGGIPVDILEMVDAAIFTP